MTPRRSRGRRLVLVAVAAVALVLAACSEVKNNGQNSLEPKGPQAQKIYDLFVPILIIAIVVGIAIIVATVFLALKFRHKKGTNENPKQVHGNTRLEIGWTIIPALILAVIAVPTVATIFDLAENPRARRRCRSTSRASSGGGSSATPTPRSSPPTRWSSRPAATCSCTRRVRRQRHVEDVQRHPQLLGPGARRQEGRRARPDQHADAHRGRQARHLPRAVRRVLRPLARQHAASG